jgi:hypothetical protein
LLLGPDGPLEEVHTHQQRLTPLPAKGDVRHSLRLYVLFGERIEQVLAHAEVALRIETFFGKVVAVCTVQIADRPA